MQARNGMTAAYRSGNHATAKGLGGRGMRPNASYHMPAPMTRDELEVCAILLGGITLIGIVGTTLLNLLAAI